MIFQVFSIFKFRKLQNNLNNFILQLCPASCNGKTQNILGGMHFSRNFMNKKQGPFCSRGHKGSTIEFYVLRVFQIVETFVLKSFVLDWFPPSGNQSPLAGTGSR